MPDNKVQHHHHHHHHHSRSRRSFLRAALRMSLIIAVSIVAFLSLLLVLYFGMRDKPNLGGMLLRLMPAFVAVGGGVGLVYFIVQRNDYDRSRQ